MEGKKKFLDNFRLKTKMPNIRKPRKKPLAKQPRNLANRRSLSVPDLSIYPGIGSSAESGPPTTPSDKIFPSTSTGPSDTESVASIPISETPLFAEKLTYSHSELPCRSNQPNVPGLSSTRFSCPPAYKEGIFMNTTNPGSNENVGIKGSSAQEDRNTKTTVKKLVFEPEPEDNQKEKEIVHNVGAQALRSSSSIAAVIGRPSSFGDEKRPHVEKKTAMFETKQSTFEKMTLQTSPPNSSSERQSLLASQVDGVDALSLYLACDTPSEEQTTMVSDEEEDDEQVSSSSLLREISREYGPLDMEMESMEENYGEMCEPGNDYDENNIESAEFNENVHGCDVQTSSRFQRYLLVINLKYGQNLVIRSRRSGSSDPYVKFKLEGKQFYKSKVIYKSLHPRWYESFSYAIRDKEHEVEVRVYDKNLTADDFMGSSTIDLKELELHKTHELELKLQDPKSKEENMGVIVVEVRLMFRDATIKRGPRFRPKKKQQNQGLTPRTSDPIKTPLRPQIWTGLLHITLLEGQDFPQLGQGDVYVRFTLDDQKYRSKNLCIQPNPQWREQFDFNHFEDQEPLQVEVFAKRGRKGAESWGMFEVDLRRLPLNEMQQCSNLLNPGRGKLVFQVKLRPCWGVSISDGENPLNQEERDTWVERLSLKNTHKCLQEVGFLQITVLRGKDLVAADINGKTNPFCVIELGNCKLQTQTVYRTINPEWNKTFTFPIKDIHDVVVVSVFDENGDKSPSHLGKVAIPLPTVQNGEQVCLLLKKEDLGRTSKGTIKLVLEVIYNKVRAGIKTFQPKEAKLIEENPKFNKKILARNIYRVRKISTAVLYTLQYIKSCFQWESTRRSLIAFLIFLVTVWHWELFMLPLFLLLLIGWNYVQLSREKASSNQDLVNMAMGDDEEEDEKEPGKKGLMEKIHMVQEVVLVVQNVLEEIANIGERVKNIFNWSVPFMSWLACLVLFAVASLLYLIPLRYIVLVWGINKFTKKLRNPYCIDSNEILDFLQRVPSDIQKVQYSVLRASSGQNQLRKKK